MTVLIITQLVGNIRWPTLGVDIFDVTEFGATHDMTTP